jgi:hypothetical protein
MQCDNLWDSKGTNMCRRVLHFTLGVVLFLSPLVWSQGQNQQAQKQPANGGDFSNTVNPVTKVPEGVILVKGAWSSASDSVTPVPEVNRVENNIFTDPYFGLSYALAPGWTKGYDGPPPSDSGRYVLSQFQFSDPHKTQTRGSILITAQDMFFNPTPASNALQLVNYMKDNLQADYKLQEPPTPTKVAGHPFTFFAYWSPVAELHWYVLATEIRCHTVQFVLTSRDTKLLGSLVADLDQIKLPDETNSAHTGSENFPVCLKDYARGENITAKVDPVFTEHRVNAVPVRIIIDKNGKVKHIHFLSAFPDQAKTITDALGQWKFKPYLQDGHPIEVETGIMFGRAQASTATRKRSVE